MCGGVTGVVVPPYVVPSTAGGSWGATNPPVEGYSYIRWVNLPLILCVDFAHGFGHNGFMSMVFCRSGQENYVYVLI